MSRMRQSFDDMVASLTRPLPTHTSLFGGGGPMAGLPPLKDTLKARQVHLDEADAILAKAESEKRPMSGPENTAFNAAMAKVDSFNKTLDAINQRNAELAAGNPFNNRATAAPGRMLIQPRTTEERAQLDELAGYLSGQLHPSALSDLTPTGDGGVLIPEFVRVPAEKNWIQEDSVRQVAFRYPTDTGANTVFPVISDEESAEQLAAFTTTGSYVNPTSLDGITLKAWKVSSKPVAFPRELEIDQADGGNVVNLITDALIGRVIRFENDKFTNGAGTTEAEGFLTSCARFESSGAIDLDLMLDLAYDVPARFRARGVYQMSDATAKYLRKLKTGISGDKRVIWTDANFQTGQPATLHGYPVYINNDMPDIQTNGDFIDGEVAFGDFSKFVIREAERGQLYILRYPVPDKDSSAVIVFRRTDSRLIVPEAISKLAIAGC